MSKAVVAKVDLGFTVIEGLQLPDGSYAIGVSQAAKCLEIPTSNASRYFRTLLKKDRLRECVTELTNTKVNILSVDEFALVVKLLAMKGSTIALSFLGVTPKPARAKSQELKGYVYFILNLDQEVIKIGMSVNPVGRLNALRTSNHNKLMIAATIATNNMRALEAKLHKKFKPYRLNGEWFTYSEEIAKFVFDHWDGAN